MEKESKKKKTAVRLTLTQVMRSCDWLRANWAMIEEKRPTRYQLCGMLREALEFRVSDSSLTKLLEAIGKPLPTALAVRPKRTPENYTDRLRTLAKVVESLYVSLGVEPPQELLGLIDHRRTEAYKERRRDRLAGDATPAASSPEEPPKPPEPAAPPATISKSKPSRKELRLARRALEHAIAEARTEHIPTIMLTEDELFAKLGPRSLDTLRRGGQLDSLLSELLPRNNVMRK
jgi:hypothetical protein